MLKPCDNLYECVGFQYELSWTARGGFEFLVNDQSNVAPEPKSLVVYNYRDTEERYIPRTAQRPNLSISRL